MRRFVRILGTLMIVAGLLMGAWAFTVWRWQDPFTAVLNHFEQRELSQNLERRFDGFVAAAEPVAPVTVVRTHPALPLSARKWERSSKQGDAVARLRIPRLGLTSIVVERHRPRLARAGPRPLPRALRCPARASSSTSPATARPTARRSRASTACAKGDKVFLELPYGTFEYRVTGHRIVSADADLGAGVRAAASSSRSRRATRASSPRTATSSTRRPSACHAPRAAEAAPLAAG